MIPSSFTLFLTILMCVGARSGLQIQERELTAKDVGAFADSAFAPYLRNSAEPSLAVVVVRGDSVLFAKGYGQSAGQLAVSVDSTVFHIASLSKLFVAIAAMQLVEQGKWRLDAPVAPLLRDVRVPDELTLRLLLTHRSGVDAPFLADVVERPDELQPLAEYFADHPPRFSRRPGAEIRYSNYGMALAALVIERVSGEPFDAYVERHIFEPLEMRTSAIRQPPPPDIERRVATAGTRRVPDFLLPYPAGAIVSTPSDMGRFMRSLLSEQSRSESRLSRESLSELTRRQWTAHPGIPGVALGFLESDLAGVRAVFHTGARVHFSLIYLLPDRDVGVFIVHSMRQGGPFQALRTHFIREFVKRYFFPTELPGDRRRTRTVTHDGVYRPSLFSSTTIERAAHLFADTRVVQDGRGALLVRVPGGPPLHLVPSGPDVFRVQQGEQEGLAVAFSEEGSSPGRMFLSGATQDPVTFEKVTWWRRGFTHLMILGVTFTLLATYSIVVGTARLHRVILKRRKPPPAEVGRHLALPALVSSVLLLLAPATALIVLVAGQESQSPRPAIATGATILFSAALLALSTIPIAVLSWRRSYWSRRRRVYHTIFAACAAVFFVLVARYHIGPFWL